MKSFIRLSILASLASIFVFSGCMDDVYDPEKTAPITPGENPFGDDFSAPDGFNWSMINSLNLNIEVKDEFNGQYLYLIEVFTTNPLTDSNATPLAAGTANKNSGYSVEINLPKDITRLYLRQTDPKQRKEIYEYAVPENGGVLNCNLYYTPSNTRAMTRAAGDGGTSGWANITDPGYTEETYTIPDKSDEIVNGNQLNPGSVFVIKEGKTFIGMLNTYGGQNSTVYVQGTWDLSTDWASISGIDIIVLKGGKLISTGNQLTLQNNTSLTVQTGGEVKCKKLDLSTKILTKNFGTITSENYKLNTNSIIYNKGEIKITGITPNADYEHNFYIDSAILYNHGTVTGTKSRIGTNNSLDAKILNYDQASINVQAIVGGGTIVNSGYIEVKCCKNSSDDALYNNCLFIVTDRFEFRHIVLDKGSITGGKATDNDEEWLPIPYMENPTDAKITLIDGSIIKATQIYVNSGDVVFNATNTTNNAKSMIKVAEQIYFAEPTHVQLKGNLVIEGKIVKSHEEQNFAENESVNTGYDESRYTIETCGGIFNEGNEGETPKDPDFPIITESADKYTFAFEDNWPTYGDFDMNDLVITIDKMKTETYKNGSVKEFKLEGTIRAVGAKKMLGAGIRFLKLPINAGITELKGKVQGINGSLQFESGQNEPVVIICTDAHTFMGNNESDRTFINTVNESANNTPDGADFEISMKFGDNSSVQPEFFNINNLDLFVISQAATSKSKRTEIHIAGCQPTNLGATSLFGNGNDGFKKHGKYYISNENLAWGIVIPGKFAWPTEYSNIMDVYKQFGSWVTSGGKDNKDWYNEHNDNVFSY